MGRSQSTPGLVESRGRIPLEEMWVSPIAPPPYSQHSLFSPVDSPPPIHHHQQRLSGGILSTTTHVTTGSPISIASSVLSASHHPIPSRPSGTTSLHCESITGLSETPLLGSHEALEAEIKRLQEKLRVVETENAAMSMKLSSQQWDLESRIADIEMQICGASSTSSLDEERNKESVI